MTINITGDTNSKIITWTVNNDVGILVGNGTGTSFADAVGQGKTVLKNYALAQVGTYSTLSTNVGIS